MFVVVRGVIAPYFYDPLNEYFKNDYLFGGVPNIKFSTFFLHLFFRYFLNTIISLGILFLFFDDKKTMVFAVKFYSISFVVLAVFLAVLLKFNISEGYMLIFYVRRFLIHPLFVFILLPAFYYEKLKGSN